MDNGQSIDYLRSVKVSHNQWAVKGGKQREFGRYDTRREAEDAIADIKRMEWLWSFFLYGGGI